MSAALVVLLVVLFAAMQLIVRSGVNAFEDRVVQQTVRRAESLIADSRHEVFTHTAGYAIWDEMQHFVTSTDEAARQQFLASNFTPPYWKTFDIEVFTVKDLAGRDLYQVAYDNAFNGEVPSPVSMRNLTADSGLVFGATGYPDGATGLWFDPGEHQLFLVAASPILDSNGNGPSVGTAVFARRIGPSALDRLAHTAGVEMQLYRPDDAVAHGLTPAIRAVADKGLPAVGARTATRSYGWIRLPTMNDPAGAYLRISTGRSAAHQSLSVSRWVLAGTVLLGLVMIVVLVVLLRRLVLMRLDSFSDEVQGLVADVAPDAGGARLTVDGNDELGRLGRDVNELLDRIDRQRARTQLLVDRVPLVTYVLDAHGRVVRANSRARELFGDDLDGKVMAEVLPGEIVDAERAAFAKLRAGGDQPDDVEFATVDLPGAPGTTTWLRRLAPISVEGDPDGDTPVAVGLWVDISDRIRADTERAAKEHAEAIAAELERTTGELESVLRTATTVRETERRRIAAALHDDTVQVLAAVLWQLDDVRELHRMRNATGRDAEAIAEQTDAQLDRVHTNLVRAIDATRSIMIAIDPPGLRELGLQAAVEQYAAQFGVVSGIATTAQIDLVRATLGTLDAFDDADRPTLGIEARVLRTVRESLANVRRHAGATAVEIELVADGDVLSGRIRDNGIGVDAESLSEAAQTQHLGVLSMRADLTSCGGTFSIGRGADGGTEVCFSVPLPLPLSARAVGAPALPAGAPDDQLAPRG